MAKETKPYSRIYQRMSEQIDIDPSRIFMTGDKIHVDVDGPRSIGMNAIHLDRKDNSTWSISTLEGIFQYL